MAKTRAEIEKLFIPQLREGEELRWIGDNRAFSASSRSLKQSDIPVLLLTGLLALFVGYFFGKSFYGCLVLCPGWIGIIIFTTYRSSQANKGDSKSPETGIYYAITNQRILSFAGNKFEDFRLMLIADAVVDKPKNGVSTIKIYNNSNPTGNLPEPIFQLKGIAEEEAQTAYEILRQAREEALEDRAREMGIE
jgi:hypothetical protein